MCKDELRVFGVFGMPVWDGRRGTQASPLDSCHELQIDSARLESNGIACSRHIGGHTARMDTPRVNCSDLNADVSSIVV
jgi:hypothetical protein